MSAALTAPVTVPVTKPRHSPARLCLAVGTFRKRKVQASQKGWHLRIYLIIHQIVQEFLSRTGNQSDSARNQILGIPLVNKVSCAAPSMIATAARIVAAFFLPTARAAASSAIAVFATLTVACVASACDPRRTDCRFRG